MRAAIRNCMNGAGIVSKQRNRAIPELHINGLTALERAVIRNGVPMVRIQAGGTRFLPAVASFRERRRTWVPIDHEQCISLRPLLASARLPPCLRRYRIAHGWRG